MAKLKFDFTDKHNLLRIEGWAKDGATDKQIASNVGYNETYFSELKSRIPELSEALKKGRAPLDVIVENKLFQKAVGSKVKVQQAIKVKEVYYDDEGRRCENEHVEIVELEQEIPPETTAQIFWLKNRKPEQWNKPAPRIEDTEVPKDIKKGIDIDSWIKKQINKDDDNTPGDIPSTI